MQAYSSYIFNNKNQLVCSRKKAKKWCKGAFTALKTSTSHNKTAYN